MYMYLKQWVIDEQDYNLYVNQIIQEYKRSLSW